MLIHKWTNTDPIKEKLMTKMDELNIQHEVYELVLYMLKDSNEGMKAMLEYFNTASEEIIKERTVDMLVLIVDELHINLESNAK